MKQSKLWKSYRSKLRRGEEKHFRNFYVRRSRKWSYKIIVHLGWFGEILSTSRMRIWRNFSKKNRSRIVLYVRIFAKNNFASHVLKIARYKSSFFFLCSIYKICGNWTHILTRTKKTSVANPNCWKFPFRMKRKSL